MTPLPQPIVALDVSSLTEAEAIVAHLGARAGFYKVGLQLFSSEGPRAVEWLHDAGKRVFLDLKLHDIPTTVHHAAASAARLGVAVFTVHGVGGAAAVRAAVEGAGGTSEVLVVTVLTSMDLATASAALGRPLGSVEEEVLRLAALARDAGAHGVVCAASECASVLAASSGPLRVLVPGIRLAGAGSGDQSRVATPAEAARAGATYVVVGRTVTQARDPGSAYDRVVRELRTGA